MAAKRRDSSALPGLLGSGRTELARVPSSAPTNRPRRVRAVSTAPLARLESPRDAIRSGTRSLLGGSQGRWLIIPYMSVRENLTLAALPTLSRKRHRRPRRAAGNRRPLHRPAGHQDCGSRADDLPSFPAAISKKCYSRDGSASTRRCCCSTNRRGQRRRGQGRDPGPDRRTRRQRAGRADGLLGAGGLPRVRTESSYYARVARWPSSTMTTRPAARTP